MIENLREQKLLNKNRIDAINESQYDYLCQNMSSLSVDNETETIAFGFFRLFLKLLKGMYPSGRPHAVLTSPENGLCSIKLSL